MTAGEVVQVAAWLMLLGSIVYAHLNYRKLKRVIFNDLKHRFTNGTAGRGMKAEQKSEVKECS